jgi:hypothetical protein
LSEEYLRLRNDAQRTRNFREAMALARARGQLISKRLATLQASFLLGAMRQKMLHAPVKWPYSSGSAVRYSARGGRSVFYGQQSQSAARRMAATCHRRDHIPTDDHMEERAVSLAQELATRCFRSPI